MKKPILSFAALAMVTAGAWTLNETLAQPTAAPATRPSVPSADVTPATVTGSTHSIKLPALPATLPPGPGQAALNAGCVFCHTTRYISMQPNFTRKTWTDEVTKMRKTYGAPVSDEQAEQIVNYLVSIRGAEPAQTQPAH